MSSSLTHNLVLAGETGVYTIDLTNVIKGEKGERGSNGINGQKGNTGQKGVAGTDGTITTVQFAFTNAAPSTLPKSGLFPANWDGENQPPTTLQMEIGNCAYDIRTNKLYMYTPGVNTANWSVFATPITGPEGQQGAKGGAGDKGQKGEAGTDGTNGSNGAKGQKGQSGTNGTRGIKGQKGQYGAAGANGLTGPTGTKGSKGEGGEKGYQGVRGPTGQEGTKGAKGEAGINGLSGVKGDKGLDANNAGGVARSHAAFNGSGVIASICEYNISQIVRLSHGQYRVRFNTKLPSSNYTALAQSNVGNIKVVERGQWACVLHVVNDQGQYQDSDYVSVVVFHP